MKDRPLVIVLSGPSGVGKDAVLSRMKELGHHLHYTVTVTTRPMRPGEREGVDYYFVSEERFQEMVGGGEFLEWANVYGNWYGVPRKQVEKALEQGLDVIIRVDVQGAATIKKTLPEALLIFIAPPSAEQLEERLRGRSTEPESGLARRIQTAQEEMKRLPMFDYVVINYQDKIDHTVSHINAIIAAEKQRRG